MNILFIMLIVSQLFFSAVAAVYFYRSLRRRGVVRPISNAEVTRELEKLKEMRAVHLTTPLAEQTRPKSLSAVIGQEESIKALRAALCGANPQHILIYGPPGVGKTAAARLVLEEAKKIEESPFDKNSKFVEIDATTLRFDERSIADPLIGSVHDPIYQGAGAYGSAGIPQPKPGAVTQAHGGVLFIDEIGELHSMQMNKLLKVLEDRVVHFQSPYYNEFSMSIPSHIHDIFQNGLPADFRLIGATTRRPEEIPSALRSRCTEVFFEGLKTDSLVQIAENSIKQAGFCSEKGLCEKIANYAASGRDVVNMVQMAASLALMEKRKSITKEDLEWVVTAGRYQPRFVKKIGRGDEIGLVNGLAVFGDNRGSILTIEAWAQKSVEKRGGILTVTGIVEEEELKGQWSTMRRKSSAWGSVENVLTAMEQITGLSMKDFDIHINFPGGQPVDGPSAGTALFCALYSAIFLRKISPKVAMTGEVNLHGEVLPVGGVGAKLLAAKEAGAKKVFIHAQNWQESFAGLGIKVEKVTRIREILEQVFAEEGVISKNIEETEKYGGDNQVMTARAETGLFVKNG